MQRVLRGVPAADGVALGYAAVVAEPEPESRAGSAPAGPGEAERALAALGQVAEDLRLRARAARARGRSEVADILETSALIAEDGTLHDEVRRLAEDVGAESGVAQAIGSHAERLESLRTPELAARAEDIRAVGRRVARALDAAGAPALRSRPTVVVARELGPADVTAYRLGPGDVLGFAVSAGATSSHAAIMSRALGVPFVLGLGPELLALPDGQHVCLDGSDGIVVVDPDDAVQARAREKAARGALLRRRLRFGRSSAHGDAADVVQTADGRVVEVLCNVNGPGDVTAALASGSPGIGLLRTELAFLAASDWPTETAHCAALEPIAAALAGRLLTLRTLDFGADKTPPFLAGERGRGLELTLRRPAAMLAQLRAMLSLTREVDIRIVFPLVQTAEQLEQGRDLVRQALEQVGWVGPPPPVGAMVETPEAVARVRELAELADFLAVGTNDLVRYTIGAASTAVSANAAADPRVLALVAQVVEAAHAHGIRVEVCGESAGQEAVVPLLIGLGVDELSVTPRRVDLVRLVVRAIRFRDVAQAAEHALHAASVDEALALARETISGCEAVDELRQVRDGLGGILA